ERDIDTGGRNPSPRTLGLMLDPFFPVHLVGDGTNRSGIAEMSARAHENRRELLSKRARRAHEYVADIETGRNPGDQSADGIVVRLPYHRSRQSSSGCD